MACAYRLFKVANPEGAGIRISPGKLSEGEARYCKQCPEPACLESCDVGAIYQADGLVRIDYNCCTGCGACVNSCPFGRMFWCRERG
ncbi:MAG: 4Fe-4S dicluster domain-containing protein, partial [Candidatus Nezhaarchaeales archaeon]